MMTKKILLLTVATLALSACGTSKDDDVARCDTIAAKYVEYFATKDEAGEIRSSFLRECVQGPDDETDSQRDAWLTCAEDARTAGDLIKCKKDYQHAVKQATLEEMGKLTKQLFVEGVCKEKSEDDKDYKELKKKAEKLESKARDAGVESDELAEAVDFMGDKTFDDVKTELCKDIKPEPEAAAPAKPG